MHQKLSAPGGPPKGHSHHGKSGIIVGVDSGECGKDKDAAGDRHKLSSAPLRTTPLFYSSECPAVPPPLLYPKVMFIGDAPKCIVLKIEL